MGRAQSHTTETPPSPTDPLCAHNIHKGLTQQQSIFYLCTEIKP